MEDAFGISRNQDYFRYGWMDGWMVEIEIGKCVAVENYAPDL